MDEIPTILVDPLPDDIKMVRWGPGAAALWGTHPWQQRRPADVPERHRTASA